jgi:hypothetical protein
MALGSWMGIYISVSDDLMAERREQELLLFMAIARHADRLGFCYPGRARLMAMRRISQPVYERRLSFLEERGYVKMTESYDWRRRQPQYDFQVSPRALYVREEFQDYCERVFDGLEERNTAIEKWLLENHFSTNDSQPETEPDAVTRRSKPEPETRRRTRDHNQRGDATTQKGRNASTMRNGDQRESANQPTATDAIAHRKNNPQAGGPDEFDSLLSPAVDDDRLVQEIKHAVATTDHQAKQVVETYPREGIVHWLRITAHRRAKGELIKPGGWFFKMLREQVPPLVIPEPNNPAYQDLQNQPNSDQEEI